MNFSTQERYYTIYSKFSLIFQCNRNLISVIDDIKSYRLNENDLIFDLSSNLELSHHFDGAESKVQKVPKPIWLSRVPSHHYNIFGPIHSTILIDEQLNLLRSWIAIIRIFFFHGPIAFALRFYFGLDLPNLHSVTTERIFYIIVHFYQFKRVFN